MIVDGYSIFTLLSPTACGPTKFHQH